MKLCRTCDRPAAKGRKECLSCYGHRRRGTAPNPKVAPGGAKILLIDIETSPNVADVWGLWNNNVSLNQLRESTRMICFAAKWYGRPGTMFFSEHEDGPSAMVAAAHELLDEADVVMHYNGKKFDVPHLYREFLLAGLTPPSPFKQIDLCNVVKKQFRFPSNKLQYVSTALGLAGKVSHEGHELWVKCMAGDPDAWARMEKYNRQDVVLLEEVYEILLPWIPGHPHRHLYGGGGCPTCGHFDVQIDGVYHTSLSTFTQYHCPACGSWFRGSRRLGGVDIQEAVR